MNDTLKRLSKAVSSPKIMIAVGLAGILIILLSTLFTGGKEEKNTDNGESIKLSEYRNTLQDEICSIVTGITGDKSATVVVTLESGIKYTYVDSVSSDSTTSHSDSAEQSSEKLSRSYVSVKNADGGEQALLVTETMPKVRGVAIVCSGGDDTDTAEKIESAVMAALDITAKRIYVSGGKVYEKR